MERDCPLRSPPDDPGPRPIVRCCMARERRKATCGQRSASSTVEHQTLPLHTGCSMRMRSTSEEKAKRATACGSRQKLRQGGCCDAPTSSPSAPGTELSGAAPFHLEPTYTAIGSAFMASRFAAAPCLHICIASAGEQRDLPLPPLPWLHLPLPLSLPQPLRPSSMRWRACAALSKKASSISMHSWTSNVRSRSAGRQEGAGDDCFSLPFVVLDTSITHMKL